MQPVEVILLAIFLIQFIYWLVLYIGLNLVTSQGEAVNVPVSIIVCAHNESNNLRQLLPLLQAQQHQEFEIIVVNDFSNDGTYDLLVDESQKDPRIKVVHIKQRPNHVNGKKYGLTLGIQAAQYEWILLTDADCRPASTEWIKIMSAHFIGTNTFVLGYSPYLREPGLLNSFIRFETIVTAIQLVSFCSLGKPYMATGRNLAYRKKIFLDNKGFNGHINVTGGDDDLFVNKHSKGSTTRVALHPKAVVFSEPKRTWKDYYFQKLRHLAVGKHYRLSTRFMLAPFIVSWVVLGPCVILAAFTTFGLWMAGFILLRWFMMAATIYSLCKKSGEAFEEWKIPVLDFIFCFYYLVAGFSALITKRIQWKT